MLKRCGFFMILFCCIFSLPAQSQQGNIAGKKITQWHRFEKISFQLDNTEAWYIKPEKPLPGNPWVWRAHFPSWHTTMDSLLLEKGFYIAYINTNDQYGAPRAMQVWNDFYHYLTTRLSFASRVALEGVSRGGLYVYGWAKRNPDKVSCIYAEAPVCDIKSWPGGKGKGEGSGKNWEELKQVYGLSESAAMKYEDNPMDHLEGLAAFKVPVLHVVGIRDHVVPPAENTFMLVQRYTALGGPAFVYPMTRGPQELEGHHFTIEHPEWWADFIYRHSYPVKKPLAYDHYFNIRGGLSQTYRLIAGGKKVTVAFLGGSITHNPGWRNKVCKYLQERFPETAFRFISAGIPSLGSLPDVFRLQQDVLDSGKVDLLFVEAAVNDRVNGTDSLTQVRDLEGIVRHARKSNPAMDIVFMSFADPDKLKDYESGKIPVAVYNHELVATHYKLPSINLAKEVYDKTAAGEFSWEYDFQNLHPAPFGQELYFQTIKSLLSTAFEKGGTDPVSYEMPSYINKYSFGNGQYLSIREAHLQNGWQLVENWHPSDKAHTREGFVNKPMLIGKTPGAELSLSFTGSAIGMALISGPDAGVVEYSIDGKSYHKTDLYTQWSGQLHLPWYILFAGDLKNRKHTLCLRITNNKNPESKGTACRIVYFLINK